MLAYQIRWYGEDGFVDTYAATKGLAFSEARRLIREGIHVDGESTPIVVSHVSIDTDKRSVLRILNDRYAPKVLETWEVAA